METPEYRIERINALKRARGAAAFRNDYALAAALDWAIEQLETKRENNEGPAERVPDVPGPRVFQGYGC